MQGVRSEEMRLGPNQEKRKKENNLKNAYVVLGPQGGWADELVIQNQSLACRPLWTLQGDPQDLSQPPASRHADHATETRRRDAHRDKHRGAASEDATAAAGRSQRHTQTARPLPTSTPRALFLVPMQERRTDTLDETRWSPSRSGGCARTSARKRGWAPEQAVCWPEAARRGVGAGGGGTQSGPGGAGFSQGAGVRV